MGGKQIMDSGEREINHELRNTERKWIHGMQ